MGLRSIDGDAAPESIENRTNAARFALQQGASMAVLALFGVLGILVSGNRMPGLHTAWLLILLASCVFIWTPLLWLGVRHLPVATFPLISICATAIVTAAAFALGPSLSLLVGLPYVILGTTSFVSLERRAALIELLPVAIGYGTVVVFQRGNSAPFTRWVVVVGAVVIVGMTVAWLVDRMRILADAERRATVAEKEARDTAERAQAETAELNRVLESRVTEQVSELERLGRLRRFLSTPVADAVLSTDTEHLLEPHRREIAVLFCDLRGFTAFATAAQPEEVHGVLEEYFGLLGEMVRRFEATVGAFTGDGLMAFFNDPLPCPAPALRAITMAVECQAGMQAPIGRWSERGYDLGFGVGVAYGYANIGMIGFEGRVDYSALGPVVNLAARLCGEASSGDVLIDQRAYAESKDHIDVGGGQDFVLKGFRDLVKAYRVSGVRPATEMEHTGT